MAFKGFAEYITEATKEITFTFGRFNPPTTGHEKLLETVAKVARGNKYVVYASQSNDPKKNPLDYTTKVKYMRKMYPRHARSIMMDNSVKTVFDILSKLYDQGYSKVNMVVGSDRVSEFEALTNKYNNVKGRHGFYNFEGGVTIVSAGERDPDAEGVSGMSASKMRAAAEANDFASFSKGLPRGFKDGQALFNDVRKGMGLKESYNYREHIQLETVSEEREQYVQGELFAEGDLIVVKESDEVGQVIMLGANYVLVEMADGKKLRKWISDIEKIEEGAYTADTKDRIEREKEQDANKHARMMAKAAEDDAREKEKEDEKKDKLKAMKVESFSSFADLINEDTKAGLKAKADKSGISYAILKKVFDRGLAAYKTSHRPGTTASQWAYARVNSFISGGKTRTTADADLWRKHKGE